MSGARAVNGGGADQAIDWQAIERSPEFGELVAARRRFVVPAAIFFLIFFLTYLLLAALARDFMSIQIVDGFTVGFALALSQIAMTWAITFLYLRRAGSVFEPLEQRAAAVAEQRVESTQHRSEGSSR
ncbi:MAG: DUF485 domain-containing protein [Thermoleophilaceae bacterium]|nr:DUF485 domain-containing protein [Thermoleophilaceae bacterium]